MAGKAARLIRHFSTNNSRSRDGLTKRFFFCLVAISFLEECLRLTAVGQCELRFAFIVPPTREIITRL